jgi:undecaprenyl-diphosphatase
LSAPIVAGAGLKSLLSVSKGIQGGVLGSSDFLLFAVGFLAAATSGYFCIKLLLRFLQHHPTNIFVYYRWILAVLVLAIALFRG